MARDLDQVAQVVKCDDAVDKLWYRVLADVEKLMQEQSEAVPQAVALLLVARYLERVADHTVNIAERIAYMETGRLEALAPSHRADYRGEAQVPDDPGPEREE